MPHWSMTRRLTFATIAIITTLWLAGITFAALSTRHEVDEVFDSALQETAQRLLPLAANDIALQKQVAAAPPPLASNSFDDGHREYLHYQVRDRSGAVLLRSHNAPLEPFMAPLERGYYDDGKRRYFTELSSDGALAVQVAELPEERQEAIEALWFGLLVPLLVVLPLAALAIRATVKRTTRPVHELRNELRDRDGTNLSPIDAHSLPDELKPLVSDVNRLLERLSSALEAERSFAANSAHELRNPIAAARAQADVLALSASSETDQRRASQIAATLAGLGRKIETLLQLARTEAGIGLSREPAPMSHIVKLLLADYARKPGMENRIQFRDLAGEPVTVATDPDALGIAVQNLIDNALKHGAANTNVMVTLGPGRTLSVANDCPVLASDELDELKLRFKRGRKNSGEGAGLGLYITDTIARQSCGGLDLYSPARAGTAGFEAVLTWPEN